MYLTIMPLRRRLEQVQINYRCEKVPIVAALQHRNAKTCADFGAAELSGCALYSRETLLYKKSIYPSSETFLINNTL